MSEISDLKDAINALRQGITGSTSDNRGTGGAVATGVAAAATAGIIDSAIVNSAATMITGQLADMVQRISSSMVRTWSTFETAVSHAARALTEFTRLAAYQARNPFLSGPNGVNVATQRYTSMAGIEASWEQSVRERQEAHMARNADWREGRATNTGAPAPAKTSAWDKFSTWINRATIALTGMVAVGLRHTVEGYKLTLAFERLAYSLANLMKPIVDLLTGVFNHAAAEVNFIHKRLTDPATSNPFEEPTVNKERDYVSRLREIDAAEAEGRQLYNGGIGPFAIKESYDEARKRAKEEALRKPGVLDFNLLPPFGRPEAMTPEREEQLRKGYKGLKPGQGAEEVGGGKRKNQDITPLFQTQFMGLTSLWEQMNKYVTENPGLDVVASWLEKIFNKLPDPDKGGAPTPRAQGAIAP